MQRKKNLSSQFKTRQLLVSTDKKLYRIHPLYAWSPALALGPILLVTRVLPATASVPQARWVGPPGHVTRPAQLTCSLLHGSTAPPPRAETLHILSLGGGAREGRGRGGAASSHNIHSSGKYHKIPDTRMTMVGGRGAQLYPGHSTTIWAGCHYAK